MLKIRKQRRRQVGLLLPAQSTFSDGALATFHLPDDPRPAMRHVFLAGANLHLSDNQPQSYVVDTVRILGRCARVITTIL